MLSDDYCAVLGPRIYRPRVGDHGSWCKSHEDGRCISKAKRIGPVEVWVEADAAGVQLIVDGGHGHMHLSLDSMR